MIDRLIDNLWQKLQGAFEPLIALIMPLDKNLTHAISRSNNDAFPIRANLSFMKSRDSEEIAITVDVRIKGDQLMIESDISSDDGRIIAEGPSAVLKPVNGYDISDTELKRWVGEFETFLNNNQEVLKAEILKLS